jgi:hypothetical protein
MVIKLKATTLQQVNKTQGKGSVKTIHETHDTKLTLETSTHQNKTKQTK